MFVLLSGRGLLTPVVLVGQYGTCSSEFVGVFVWESGGFVTCLFNAFPILVVHDESFDKSY